MAQILAEIRRRNASAGRSTSRTCTSTSRSGSPSWSATPASACTPGARATTRSPPTCASGCATRIDAIDALVRALQTALLDLAEQPRRHHDAGLHPPAGRAAGDASAITCWPTSRCSSATASASPIAAGASTGCRSAPPRWPAPAIRSTASSVARELGFDGVCENSLDAVSDRDFAIEFCACGGAAHDASVALVRGADPVDEPALRLHRRSPTASAPALRSCRRRRIPTCPNWCAARPGA